jgi:hypothetical protein
MMQTRQKVESKRIVALQRRSKVLSTAVTDQFSSRAMPSDNPSCERTNAQIKKDNRYLNRVDAEIIQYLNRIGRFETRRRLVERDFLGVESHAVLSQNKDGGEIPEREGQGGKYRVVVLAHVAEYEAACVGTETDDDDYNTSLAISSSVSTHVPFHLILPDIAVSAVDTPTTRFCLANPFETMMPSVQFNSIDARSTRRSKWPRPRERGHPPTYMTCACRLRAVSPRFRAASSHAQRNRARSEGSCLAIHYAAAGERRRMPWAV